MRAEAVASQKMFQLVDCVECAEVCTACADACSAEGDPKMLVRCIRLNLDCADLCLATARASA